MVSSVISVCFSVFRPDSEVAGPTVQPPFNETWAAMEELVDRKLVRSIGLSNFSPEKIQEVLNNARIRPAVNQVSSRQSACPLPPAACLLLLHQPKLAVSSPVVNGQMNDVYATGANSKHGHWLWV